ncbi:39S ribosomal protein L37, mitochondrial [Callorhinchus milii]|uniref:Large ribosomal subunit protein mL37 n=1 Tax=Callorhinchus milii TaxID=7868 RepID=A0A4W3IJC2_CALMI|nr:39S ribosomal protein L37, mitochondrial [Callorhinchus milii]|eukprot:gi/632980686/ref/XP_007907172.1/ PREDICTED: 39S ribosomal protein L37, mitochondrial [Callorhinchus milii]
MWSSTAATVAAGAMPLASSRRLLSVSAAVRARTPHPRREVPEVQIPGLEPVTYWDRMHFVPGLAHPTGPAWDRGWKDPRRYRGPKIEEMALYKERPCHIFNQRTKMLEGVKQALWLTKSKLVEGLPAQILRIAEDPANRIEEQDERVQEAINRARFWITTEIRPKRDRFSPALLQDLLHLCRTQQQRFPGLGDRSLAENYRVAVTWERETDLFQVRGVNGILLNSTRPLPAMAAKEEVMDTEGHLLPSFYPIAPTIDLQQIHVYQEPNDTGFRAGYPYPHAHTLYIDNSSITIMRFKPEALRAKMIMFAFANALARAKLVYGEEPRVLDEPITVQSVASNGRVFQFLVFQLNTTDLQPDQGVKNLVWLDSDQLLYDYAKCRPEIRKKVVQVPVGLSGYRPETFNKFLALYLHGAV